MILGYEDKIYLFFLFADHTKERRDTASGFVKKPKTVDLLCRRGMMEVLDSVYVATIFVEYTKVRFSY